MSLKKRGISPVIATVLLVLLAVILAIFIFLWARSVLTEKVQKDLGGGPMLASEVCQNILFQTDIDSTSGQVIVENTGNVPIYGVQIVEVGEGSRRVVGNQTFPNVNAVKAGKTYTFTSTGAEITSGKQYVVVPIILGTSGEVKKAYICDEKYGVSATAI